jgi:pimeloyl-ACP methyl ester carboxylesterase
MDSLIAENSTNVRAQYPSKAPPSRLAWLERTAPGLTLRLAEHWFFRPGKRHFPLDTASAERTFEIDVKGHVVRAAAWGSGPDVIGAHGWAGGGEQFRTLRERLVRAGYRFWAFDMPGHAATKGRSAHVGLFADTISGLVRRIGPTHAVIGHSLGATAAALAVSRGMQTSGVVMIAPMPSVDFALEGFTRLVGLSAESRELLKIRALARASLGEDEQSLFTLPRPPERVLLLHDRDDRMVPVQQSRVLAETWPRAELVESERRGHNRILKDADTASEVCRFLHRLPRVIETPLDRQLVQVDQLAF